MDDKLSCPYCGSAQVRLLEAIITIRLVEPPEGGPGIERICPLYRCIACGRSFDEIEAEDLGSPDSCGPGWT